MHILAIGQSNIANHCGSPSDSTFGEAVVAGETHPLRDPIAGGSGAAGSVWPRLADKLEGMPWPETLRLTLTAVGGTSIAEWAPGGPCFDKLSDRLAAGDGVGVTHVVFQQGEKDTLLETTAEDYTATFLRLYGAVTAEIGEVPWIICRSSYRFGVTNPDVTDAQAKLAATLPLAIEGPFLDALGSEFRTDDTHFNDRGLDWFSTELCAALLSTAPDEEVR